MVADAPQLAHQLAEEMAALIVPMADGYDAILAPATTTGKNFMPRVAALLDVAQISDITGDQASAGHVRAADLCGQRHRDRAVLATPPRSSPCAPPPFRRRARAGLRRVENDRCVPDANGHLGVRRRQELSKSDRPGADLGPGRSSPADAGHGNPSDNFSQMHGDPWPTSSAPPSAPAARLSTRAYVPNDYQVGQTGKVVAPELYMWRSASRAPSSTWRG